MRLIAAVLLASAFAGPAAQAPITVLSAGALEPALVQLAGQYRQESGDEIATQFGTGPQIAARLSSGDLADVLIAPASVMERASASGQVAAETRAPVARVGVGVTVRRGAAPPDIATVDALKAALRAADSIVYNRASTGLYLERLLAQLDLAEELRPRTTRYDSGDQVLTHVAGGRGNEIGFGAITEIREFESKGLMLVGPLPADVQNYTTYVAAVTAAARDRARAARFVRYLGTPEAKRVFAATGVH